MKKGLIAVLVTAVFLMTAGLVVAAETTGDPVWEHNLPSWYKECQKHKHTLAEDEFTFIGGVGFYPEYVLSKTNSIVGNVEYTAPDFDIFDVDRSELKAVIGWKVKFGKVE